jgi:hypothetical protein
MYGPEAKSDAHQRKADEHRNNNQWVKTLINLHALLSSFLCQDAKDKPAIRY